MKEKRKALSNEEICRKSAAVCGAFLKSKIFLQSRTICIYMNAFKEVDTSRIINECKKLKKTVVIPVVDGDDIYTSVLTDDIRHGAFGIREPENVAVFDKEKIDLFVVPGLAFDSCGGRIGFGGGYYDKLLSGLNAVKAGFLYDFQLVPDACREKHDIKMNYLFSESMVIDCEARLQRS